jgi:hypothetical protein
MKPKPIHVRTCGLAAGALLLCLSLASCNREQMMKKFVPAADEAAARHYFELLRQKQFDQIIAGIEPSFVDSGTTAELTNMAEILPPGEPRSVKVVGVNIQSFPGARTDNLDLEYEYPDAWYLVTFGFRQAGGRSTVTSFYVAKLTDSLEHQNRFTFAGKGTPQLLILGLAIAALAFSVYVFVLLVRARGQRLKWLWGVAILTGAAQITVNWTTGEWYINPFSIHIPCLAISSSGFSPWFVTASIPFDALAYMVLRSSRRAPVEASPIAAAIDPAPH